MPQHNTLARAAMLFPRSSNLNFDILDVDDDGLDLFGLVRTWDPHPRTRATCLLEGAICLAPHELEISESIMALLCSLVSCCLGGLVVYISNY